MRRSAAPACTMIAIAMTSSLAFAAPSVPHRIVSLAPNLTDLLVTMGASEEIVGVTSFSVIPQKGTRIIGDLLHWNTETLVALRPDIILSMASGSVKRNVEHLKKIGLPVSIIRIESAEDLLAAVDKLGSLLHRSEEALHLSQKLQRDFKPHPMSTLRALLLTSMEPMFASSSRTFEGDLLRRAGWSNALPDQHRTRPKISLEHALALDPDAIIVAAHDESAFDRWRAHVQILRAARSGRIFRVDPNLILRPGPRAGEGFQSLREPLGDIVP